MLFFLWPVPMIRQTGSGSLRKRLSRAACRDEKETVRLRSPEGRSGHGKSATRVGVEDARARWAKLVAARNLHIVDVYDADPSGKRQRAFGRVFYTEGNLRRKKTVGKVFVILPFPSWTRNLHLILNGRSNKREPSPIPPLQSPKSARTKHWSLARRSKGFWRANSLS